MSWKYLQYETRDDAVSARNEHFKNCSGNACRLMPHGKLAYMGTFGGTLPASKKRGWSDAAREKSAEVRRNHAPVKDSIVGAINEVRANK